MKFCKQIFALAYAERMNRIKEKEVLPPRYNSPCGLTVTVSCLGGFFYFILKILVRQLRKIIFKKQFERNNLKWK